MDDLKSPAIRTKPFIRPAQPEDVDVLHRFVVELAEVEEFPGEVTARPQDLAAALFGPRPAAEAVVAVVDGAPAGFALFYSTYSTIVGRPGIHLDDLYVRAEHRGSGLGRALLGHLAQLAVERGCGRLEWWVLRTNDPALRFYRGLRARALGEIEVMRLDGEVLRDLAAATRTFGEPAR
ncbi:GNAT family N-acetyltransferase [Planomonospora sp. ID82291]|uniref:GNAT family N-acetyltransferase n=1 Tax=Planomonospora sp. ID82291 TaxID=2738136 RepID=UPI0027DD338A|nr:GNAT family N-acetyltransferase [Planomonospora sp. ID82291]